MITYLRGKGRSPQMVVQMIVFAWLYFAVATEGTITPRHCDEAKECCFYLPETSSEFQNCCFRHGCCPANCNSFTDATCCYNASSYHLGSIVSRLPECCTNLVCGAKLIDSPPFIITSIVPVSIPPPPGHYCDTPKIGYCVQVNGIIRNEGSEWFETPCRLCRCEKGEIRCRGVRPVCPLAPEPHCHPIPGDCCPTWDCTPINTGCEDERGNKHDLGDTWTDPTDSCKMWVCTINGPVPLPPKPCLPLESPPHYNCTVVVVDCCHTWDCSAPTSCVDNYGVNHEPGEVWIDQKDSCTTHVCTSSGIHSYKKQCPSPGPKPNEKCTSVIVHCCHQWSCLATGCVDESGHHNLGDVWTDPTDSCYTLYCTPNGIQRKRSQCPEMSLRPNPSCTIELQGCCYNWTCPVTTGCEDYSGHHNLGDVWTDPADPCYSLSCTPSGIQRSLIPCPPLSPRPSISCTIKLQGCCYNWTCPIATGCIDDSGSHHNLGHVWDDPVDPCYTLTCTSNGIQRSPITCPPLSPPPHYSCSLQLQGGCCYNWTCQNVGCVDKNGHQRDVGEQWSHSTFHCIQWKCTATGILKFPRDCPSLGPPPQPTCTEVERDCCSVWNCPSHSGCKDNSGQPRDLGDQWQDIGLPCLTFFCTPLGVMNVSIICDELPHRPNPFCVLKDDGCCDAWDCPFGDCPDPDSFNRVCIHYHDQCYTDADCSSGSRCCLVAGCGKECIPDEKPGNCPFLGLPDPTFPCYHPVTECQNDQDCSGTQKCCESICGKKCSDSN